MKGDSNFGPATARGPDALFGQASDVAVTVLPPTLDLVVATSLRDSLAGLLANQAAALDAGSVERMSTPCAQVLLAAGRSAEAAAYPFRIMNASAVFRTALADLGLQAEFTKWMD